MLREFTEPVRTYLVHGRFVTVCQIVNVPVKTVSTLILLTVCVFVCIMEKTKCIIQAMCQLTETRILNLCVEIGQMN